ncbi:MAG: tryptophan-rich sensory protein [Synechococcaceae cyanobacterium]|nr:tryptophan-rich sensory protein [Synechococcaceae cyanobacterium]
MPAWLSILLVMVVVVLAINPSNEGYNWYQGLRRPTWTPFPQRIPLLWLAIYACLYLSALESWRASRSLPLLGLYGLLLVVLELYPWLMCRTRRLGVGAGSCLVGWALAIALALGVRGFSGRAALLLLPLVLWGPLQAAIDWSMLRLNGPQWGRLRGPSRRGS